MQLHIVIPLTMYVVCFIELGHLTAQEQLALKPGETANTVRLVETFTGFTKAVSAKKDRRRYLTAFRAFSIKGKDNTSRNLAELTHFKYEGGKTIRTTVDLDKEMVLKVEVLEAYPTPLAKEELDSAISLAREANDAVKALYTKDPDNVAVDALAPVVSNRRDPRFGHRIALLRIRSKDQPDEVIFLDVDLTTKKVKTDK